MRPTSQKLSAQEVSHSSMAGTPHFCAEVMPWP